MDIMDIMETPVLTHI